MSRIKADLSFVSLNQLCTLTGKTSRTLKNLLASVKPHDDGTGTLLYSPKEVLPIIYAPVLPSIQPPPQSGTTYQMLDPIFEKARLDKNRADKVELEVAVMRKDLIPADQIKASWDKLAGALRSRILAIPTKLAPKIEMAKSPKDVAALVKAECHQALAELADYDAEADQLQAD